MKGIENIQNKISSDAAAKAEQIINDANQKAAEIIAKAEAEIAARRKANESELIARKEDLKQRTARTAGLESRKQILAAKQEMIDLAYEKALAKLLSMDSAAYCEILSKFAGDAAKNNGCGELVFNEKDRASVGTTVLMNAMAKSGEKLTLSESTANIGGGFILRMANAEINCAIEAIVAEQSKKTAMDTAAILF